MPVTKQGEGPSPLKTCALHTCLSESPSPRPAGQARGALLEGLEPSRGFSQSEWDFPLSPRTELGGSSLSYWLERPQWADTRSRRWSFPKLSATGPRSGSFQGLSGERFTKQESGRMGDTPLDHPTWAAGCPKNALSELPFCNWALFGGHLWPKFGDRGIFMDRDIPWNPVSQNSNKCMAPFRGFAISSLHVSSENVVIGLTFSRPCCWECLIFGSCGGQNLSAREYGLYRNDLIPAFWLCHFPKISSHLCFCLNIIQVKEIKPKQQAVGKIANF